MAHSEMFGYSGGDGDGDGDGAGAWPVSLRPGPARCYRRANRERRFNPVP
jgi:hypothetical protein